MPKVGLKDLNNASEVQKKAGELFVPAVNYLKGLGFNQGIFIEFATSTPMVIPVMGELHDKVTGLINTEIKKQDFTVHYKKKEE